jgi:hypothetical protein
MTLRSDLHCDVHGLTYDFSTRTGTLRMPEGDCCDMSACITLFQAINPKVRRIETFAGATPDTIYIRAGTSATWTAFLPGE